MLAVTQAEIWGAVFHALVILGDLLVVVAIAHMLRHQRSPTSTIAWLLGIIVIPFLGVPLYFLIGGRKAAKRARLKSDLELHEAPVLSDPQHSRIDRMLRSQGIPGASMHNRIRLLGTPVEGYNGMVEVIGAAKERLHVATFIFGRDDVARDMLQRLIEKVEQGVEVRLLVDGLGTIKTGRGFFRRFVAAGGRFAVFNPMFFPFLRRSNLRNHRKITIADDRLVMTGGMNVYREEISPEPLPENWLDLSFLLEGPEAAAYAELFRSDWHYASGEDLSNDYAICSPTSEMRSVTQIVPSGPDVPGDPLYEAMMTSIFDAHRRLWLATPYFVPDEALGQALRIACNRGVDVRIFVPKRSNHFLTDIARTSFLRDILRAGGAVRFYTGGMMHAKVLLMDDHVAMVGSANFDMRSLFYNYEVMQMFYSSHDIEAVEQWLNRLAEETEPGVAPAGAIRETVEGVTRMLAPML